MSRPSLKDTCIITPRLTLRPVRRSDYTGWASIRSDSRTEIEPLEPLWSHDALSVADWARRIHAWHSGWRDGRTFVFLARRNADSRIIGGVSLTNVRYWPADAASIGYWMGTAYAGQGLMTEAVGGVAAWAFDALGLQRIEAGTLPENAASRRVLTKCGFQEEGLARAYLEIGGKRRDHVLYGLVRDTSGV